MSSHAVMQASHAVAHIAQVSLICMWVEHSSRHTRHIATHASRAAIMLSRSMPIGRSSMRIIVSHMSAQLAQRAAHLPIPSMPAIASEHIVQACIQAEHASIQLAIAVMSMEDMIDVSDMGMFFIISVAALTVCSVPRRGGHRERPGIGGASPGRLRASTDDAPELPDVRDELAVREREPGVGVLRPLAPGRRHLLEVVLGRLPGLDRLPREVGLHGTVRPEAAPPGALLRRAEAPDGRRGADVGETGRAGPRAD